MKKRVQLLTTALFVTFFMGGYPFAQDVLPGCDLFETPVGWSNSGPALTEGFLGRGSPEDVNTMPDPEAARRAAHSVLQPVPLDHFKVYRVDPVPTTYTVTLEDQFDAAMGIVESGVIDRISYFANPVSKNDGGIADSSAHLVWYRFISDEPPIYRSVAVSNQFGTDTLKIGPPEYLLVPAEKIESGSVFPDSLDHYKVYPVITGDPVNMSVTLQDQFGSEDVEVKRPLYFCNPVSKNGERIISEVDHLVFYEISPGTQYSRSIEAQDQFGLHPLYADSSVWLGVPTEKLGWEVTVPLDHFKVYLVDPVSTTYAVTLEDQFDEAMGIVESGAIDQISYFANPVSKNDGGIADSSAHLVWYRFVSDEPPIYRNVAVSNQFGTDTLKIGPPEYLLVPAEKIESGSVFPDSLDHYKVYPVITGDPVNTSVTLQDQFGGEDVEVKRPLYFCNPVSKNGERIISEVDHLVFYEISPGTQYSKSIEAQDQFGLHPLYVESSVWLGVPTEKLSWEFPPLDHFKVYGVDPVNLTALTVALEDQFDAAMGIVESGVIDRIDYFANPVSKNDGGIADSSAHLVWYRLVSDEPPIYRNVAVSNQFGTDTLKIGPPEYLLVPAEKIEPGSVFPDSLDHYKVYPVITGDSVNMSVTLQDQFGSEDVEVKRPLYFCNPVSKNGEGIISEGDHLVFYDISPGTQYSRSIEAQDQFGRHPLYADSSLWLGVPTEKLSWEIPPLDHFKAYGVDPVDLTGLPVALEDQFDKAMGIVESDTLVRIDCFANPVSKNNGGIADSSAHLVWYRFASNEPPVCRYVEVHNQFGTDTLQIGSPEYLLVPSEKIEPGSVFPVSLDHYKVYPVITGDPVNMSVTLQDQFGDESVEVMRPLYFCNPVSKNGEGIISEADHLVFYQISPGTQYTISIDVLNQFGVGRLSVESSMWLGVPTEKVSWEVTTDVPGVEPRYGDVLFQNTPNPFGSVTRIAFSMDRAQHVRLQVFDAMGRLVRTLVDGVRQPGRHEEQWDGKDERGKPMASGTYFYRLQTPGWSAVKKMTLTR